MAKIPRSERIALKSLLMGVALAAGAYWLLPVFPWWVYLLLCLFATGIFYDQRIRWAAHEKIVDSHDRPNT